MPARKPAAVVPTPAPVTETAPASAGRGRPKGSVAVRIPGTGALALRDLKPAASAPPRATRAGRTSQWPQVAAVLRDNEAKWFHLGTFGSQGKPKPLADAGITLRHVRTEIVVDDNGNVADAFELWGSYKPLD